MSARTAQLRARWAPGVLFAVLVCLSLLAHHELMGPPNDSGAPMSMSASMTAEPRSAGHGPQATPHAAAAHSSLSVAPAVMTCGSQTMCSAAGVPAPPLPAALPHTSTLADPQHRCGLVRPLPPGTGPPSPADSTSVLRI